MQAVIGQGDKITIVTRDTVLVCEVIVVRERASHQGGNSGEDDHSEYRVEIIANETIPVAVSGPAPDHGHTASTRGH